MGNKHSSSEPVGKFERDYEIIESFGRGTFGSVYLCKERHSGNEYAIKSIRLKR